MKVSKKKTSSKAVDVIDSFGNLIMVQSELRASELTGVTRSLICTICNKGGGYSKLYGFRFHGSSFVFRKQDFGRKKGKPVVVTHDGEEKDYVSISAASAHTGVPSNRICVSCKYGVIVSNKFQFRYKDV